MRRSTHEHSAVVVHSRAGHHRECQQGGRRKRAIHGVRQQQCHLSWQHTPLLREGTVASASYKESGSTSADYYRSTHHNQRGWVRARYARTQNPPVQPVMAARMIPYSRSPILSCPAATRAGTSFSIEQDLPAAASTRCILVIHHKKHMHRGHLGSRLKAPAQCQIARHPELHVQANCCVTSGNAAWNSCLIWSASKYWRSARPPHTRE